MVQIGTIGINHKTASLSVREGVARVAEKLRGEKALFFPYPTVLLSTCNRTEIYFSGEDLAEVHSELLSFFRNSARVSFEQSLYSYFGIDCFFHLCKVTSGLDSAIFAETEIQHQVKQAYLRSKFLTKELHYVFQKALKVGKTVRNHMQENQACTLYNMLWQLAKWHSQQVLLIGYSEINRGLISFLKHKQVKSITLSTRSPEKIQIEGVKVVGRDVLKAWGDFNVIVCATALDSYLIQGKGNATEVIFDLCVPRGVHPEVGTQLYNIEELTQKIQAQGQKEAEPFEPFVWTQVVRLYECYLKKTKINSLIHSV